MFTIAEGLSGLHSMLFTMAAFLFVLTVVVIFHELGHFLVARWCGVKVDAFAMGFGSEVVGWTDSKGTRWRLNWIPLGGYVMFMGDGDASSTPDASAIATMTDAQRAVSYHAKPVWQRAAVLAAGPAMNFLLAIALMTSIYMVWGVRIVPARVEALETGGPAALSGLQPGDLITRIDNETVADTSDVARIVGLRFGHEMPLEYVRNGATHVTWIKPLPKDRSDGFGGKAAVGDIGLSFPARVTKLVAGSVAAAAGLQPGDLITQLDGKAIASFADMIGIVRASAGRALAVTYERDGAPHTIEITPASVEITDETGAKVKVGQIGIQSGSTAALHGIVKTYRLVPAVIRGVKETAYFTRENLSALGKLFRHGEGVEQLGGPIKIAAVAGQAAALGFDALLNFAAMISIGIGLFNLFPVPVLDGGRLVFCAIEAIRGRAVSPKIQDYSMHLGLVMVLTIFMFVMWNDRLVVWHWIGG